MSKDNRTHRFDLRNEVESKLMDVAALMNALLENMEKSQMSCNDAGFLDGNIRNALALVKRLGV